MAFSRYSKLTRGKKTSPKVEGLDLNSNSNKVFLHTISGLISLALVLFIIALNNLSDHAFYGLADLLENLDFVEIKLSKELLNDLSLENPAVIFILVAIIGYAAYAFYDINKKTKLTKVKKSDNSYFSESADLSFALHIALLLVILLCAFLGYKPSPKVKVTSIEYIPTQVVSKKAPPKDTKRVAEKQSLSSGKHKPKQPVTPAQKASGKPRVAPSPQKQASPPKEPAKPKFKPISKPSFKPSQAKPLQQRTAAPKPSRNSFKPVTSTSRPQPKFDAKPQPSLPKNSYFKSSQSQISVPSPKSYPQAYQPSSSSEPNAVPQPRHSSSGATDSNLIAKLSSMPRSPSLGSGGAYGAPSNPEPNNNPNGPDSLAARADVSLGPYMSGLQRKIKMAWKPPRGTESNRIVVLFTINTNGYLEDLEIITTSRSSEANAAALDAVKRAAPFGRLPAGAPPSLPIEFTFDYSVFKKQRL